MTGPSSLAAHADDAVCDLETIGRSSGLPRRIEIWFAADGDRLFLLAGGRHRAHWVRNVVADPRVRVHFGSETIAGRARIIEGEGHELRARQLVAAKYQGWEEGRPLSRWAATSLPVEVTPAAPDVSSRR